MDPDAHSHAGVVAWCSLPARSLCCPRCRAASTAVTLAPLTAGTLSGQVERSGQAGMRSGLSAANSVRRDQGRESGADIRVGARFGPLGNKLVRRDWYGTGVQEAIGCWPGCGDGPGGRGVHEDENFKAARQCGDCRKRHRGFEPEARNDQDGRFSAATAAFRPNVDQQDPAVPSVWMFSAGSCRGR